MCLSLLMSDMINSYIQKVLDFLKEHELEVSPTKIMVMLFTPNTKEANIHPDVKMVGIKVDLVKSPNPLGSVLRHNVYFQSPHQRNGRESKRQSQCPEVHFWSEGPPSGLPSKAPRAGQDSRQCRTKPSGQPQAA